MKTIISSCSVLLVLLISYFSGVHTPAHEKFSVPDATMAIYDTDQYVWQKMVRTFSKNPKTSLMKWETWASAEYTYGNPCCKLPWPDQFIDTINTAGDPKKVKLMQNSILGDKNFETTAFTLLTFNFENPYYEELRLNKVMFDYIQENALYNKDSVVVRAMAEDISFPQKAMMIKAQWIPISEDQKSKYYHKVLTGKKTILSKKEDTTLSVDTTALMGLVGFHLVTHELPNWVWSTFEYVENPGRCDYIGCKDRFGSVPHYQAPNPDGLLNQGYPEGNLTPELAALFDEYEVPEQLKNYRLKGSQTEFTNTMGENILLGNSILEANIVASSSCITCHAYATLNAEQKSLGMFVGLDPTVMPDQVTDKNTLGIHPIAVTGIPDATKFNVGTDSAYYQVQFMWQLAQRPISCDTSKQRKSPPRSPKK